MERKIIYTNDVKLFLRELFEILYEKNYFGFLADAEAYVDKLTRYADQYIGILPGRKAPAHFDCYGSDLKYITFLANKTTTWYLVYIKIFGLLQTFTEFYSNQQDIAA